MALGKIIGLAFGILLAYFFILPDGILYDLQLTSIPLVDLARVFAAIVITLAAVTLGHFIDVL